MKQHLAALLCAVVASSCGAAPPKLSFNYAEKRARLSNGLRLVVVPDKNTSLVQVDVRYEVGSNEDPPGKAGIAHLVEHMMFQHRMLGPDKPATFALIPQVALAFNAYTIYDKTHYWLLAPKEDLETLLKIEAFRMNAGCETIPEDEFLREREVVRNEIRERGGTPEGLALSIVSEDVYPKGHPYSHITGGDDAQLASIQFQDVCNFMKNYYVPERATVVVSGNVDPANVGKLVNGTFGGIAKRAPAARALVTPIDLKYKKVVHELDLEHPQVWVFWKLPPRSSKDWTKVQALFQLVGKLAQQADEWEFATSVQTTMWGGESAPTFALIMDLPPGGDTDEALDYVWKATKTAHWGLKNADFDTETKSFLKMGFVESLESLSARGDRVADEIQFGDGSIAFDSTKEYMMKEYFEYDQLTADGYSEFVKSTLDKDKAVVVVFKPSATGKKGDVRAKVSYSGKSHDQQPEPLVDPTEAKRPLPAPKSNSVLGKAQRYTLGNGMKVILLPSSGLPIVHAQLVFTVGAANESPKNAGLASAAARFLRPPRDSNFRAFASFGGFADDDTTTFISRALAYPQYTEVVIKGLERLVKIGEYDQESLEKWHKRIKDGFKSADFRRELAFEQEIASAIYGPEHPYTTNGQPTPDSVGNIGYDAAMSWKNEHYSAKNATLIVVGSFDAAYVKELVDDNFGDWDGGHQDKPVAPTQRARSGAEYIGVVGEERPQVQIELGFPAPAGIDGQQAARLVLTQLLSDRMGEIRTELGSTYGIRTQPIVHLGPAAYLVTGGIDAPRAGETLKAIHGKLEGLRQGENFDKGFALARRAVLKRLLTSSSETGSLADRLARIAGFGLGPDYYDNLVRYVAAVSPAQVKALIATELDPKMEAVVLLADRKTLEKAFKDAEITTPKYVEPK
jgi:zinc protease